MPYPPEPPEGVDPVSLFSAAVVVFFVVYFIHQMGW